MGRVFDVVFLALIAFLIYYRIKCEDIFPLEDYSMISRYFYFVSNVIIFILIMIATFGHLGQNLFYLLGSLAVLGILEVLYLLIKISKTFRDTEWYDLIRNIRGIERFAYVLGVTPIEIIQEHINENISDQTINEKLIGFIHKSSKEFVNEDIKSLRKLLYKFPIIVLLSLWIFLSVLTFAGDKTHLWRIISNNENKKITLFIEDEKNRKTQAIENYVEADEKEFSVKIGECAYFVGQVGATLGFGDITPLIKNNQLGELLVIVICAIHILFIVIVLNIIISGIISISTKIDEWIKNAIKLRISVLSFNLIKSMKR